jgi:hypothetical protein
MKLWPPKYYAGLSKGQATRRRKEIARGKAMSWKNPAAYRPFQTDKGVKTKASGYTADWKRRFPQATSLEQKAAATGVPLTYIKESYDRGMAAWRTGHRPGATQQQWGYARVHSFLLGGKTYHTTDADIAARAKAASAKAKAWWASL